MEFRLLVGPNVYFPRPAAKLTLDLTTMLELSVDDARTVAAQLGISRVRPGPSGSAFRQRSAARLVATVVRKLALSGDVVAIMAHQQRAEIDAWLEAQCATRVSAATLRDKVKSAHG